MLPMIKDTGGSCNGNMWGGSLHGHKLQLLSKLSLTSGSATGMPCVTDTSTWLT